MTDQDFAGVGRAFADYLRAFRPHAGFAPTAGHFGAYCRGLLSGEPRKTVEPLALRAGTTVRTLQVFLKDADWDEAAMGVVLRRTLAAAFAKELDRDGLGTVGLVDETGVLKKGTKTPGVQRQYLGCVGKVDNGIVTVHLGRAGRTSRRSWTRSCTCPSRGTPTGSGVARRGSRTRSGTSRSGGWRCGSGRGRRPRGSASTG